MNPARQSNPKIHHTAAAAAAFSPPGGAPKVPEDERTAAPLLESHSTPMADVLDGSSQTPWRSEGEHICWKVRGVPRGGQDCVGAEDKPL